LTQISDFSDVTEVTTSSSNELTDSELSSNAIAATIKWPASPTPGSTDNHYRQSKHHEHNNARIESTTTFTILSIYMIKKKWLTI
jgi:hypothetical protein